MRTAAIVASNRPGRTRAPDQVCRQRATQRGKGIGVFMISTRGRQGSCSRRLAAPHHVPRAADARVAGKVRSPIAYLAPLPPRSASEALAGLREQQQPRLESGRRPGGSSSLSGTMSRLRCVGGVGGIGSRGGGDVIEQLSRGSAGFCTNLRDEASASLRVDTLVNQHPCANPTNHVHWRHLIALGRERSEFA